MRIDDTIGVVLKGKSQGRVLAIRPGQTVFEALEIMAEYEIGALLVCSDNHLLGILSERDYARKCALLGHTSKETRVEDIMTSPVLSVSPRSTVDECLALMTEHHFRHLPVVEDDKVVGIVSIGDLVKWVINTQQQAIGALESYITGGYQA
ncbi:MAG TPA: CBS domain-containing protein [Terracidiphilus sp.]|jgi:CBS domain-containing protein|nr:CBS domain-containing protein [Terracidiphilus sp.]